MSTSEENNETTSASEPEHPFTQIDGKLVKRRKKNPKSPYSNTIEKLNKAAQAFHCLALQYALEHDDGPTHIKKMEQLASGGRIIIKDLSSTCDLIESKVVNKTDTSGAHSNDQNACSSNDGTPSSLLFISPTLEAHIIENLAGNPEADAEVNGKEK